MTSRRPPTPVSTAARRDLKALPKPYCDSAVAKAYLELAKLIDFGMTPKDAASIVREMRLCYMTLDAMAPHKPQDDFVDEFSARRTEKMRALGSAG